MAPHSGKVGDGAISPLYINNAPLVQVTTLEVALDGQERRW